MVTKPDRHEKGPTAAETGRQKGILPDPGPLGGT